MSTIVLCSIAEGHKGQRKARRHIPQPLQIRILQTQICFLVSGNVQVYHPPCLNQYIIQDPIAHPLMQITFV